MNSRNSSSKEDRRSYGSFHHAEENASDVETHNENKSVDRQRKCVVIIAVLVILTAVIVTLAVYYTPGQQDQVGN